jgi:hypothetical protein
MISTEFEKYMIEEKNKELENFCNEEKLDETKLEVLISDYVYT